MFKKYIFLWLTSLLFVSGVKAVQTVKIVPGVNEHLFRSGEYEFIEDLSGKLTFDDIRNSSRFEKNTATYPVNKNPDAVYWYRLRVAYDSKDRQDYVLEFLNHGLEDLTVYIPLEHGGYSIYHEGAKYPFARRVFSHKNFVFKASGERRSIVTYYFRIRSSTSMSIVVAHKSWNRFIQYASAEYLFFGLFYGMIIIFSLYNLILYIGIRERHYLYYVMYVLAVGLYEISTDGIAYQYLWPDAPSWNEYAFGTWLTFVSVFALLFAIDLLHLKARSLRLYRFVRAVIYIRIAYYLVCLCFFKPGLNYTLIELIPLSVAFFSGIRIWQQGYKPARLLVLAYAFLFTGFIAKLLVNMGYGYFIPGPAPHYSMSIGFVCEMILLSLAIGDKVRLLKKSREEAQELIISQMEENVRLKEEINLELEAKVAERTRLITEKSDQIQQQAEEIARINLLLEKDNLDLHTNIKKVTQSRLLSAEVSFEEFSKEYPDKETCFKFLAELKWSAGYSCKKCGNTNYWTGNTPFSRKCSHCKYDESVIVGTLLENTRIPVNKALYAIYLVYTTKGKISSHKLSEILSIRQSTCWTYTSKINKVMESRKKELRNAGDKGWSKLLIE